MELLAGMNNNVSSADCRGSEYAERLQRLADDPDQRERMSEAALKRVAALGGWDAYGERMVSVLTELVDGPGALRSRQEQPMDDVL